MNPFRTNPRILTLALARMANSLGNSFPIVVLPLYIASKQVTGDGFGLSTSALTGFILAVFGLTSALTQTFAGCLSDWLGKRKLFISLGLVVLGAALVALGVLLVQTQVDDAPKNTGKDSSGQAEVAA